ncbi:hypothetical protein C7N43_10245 [Sphingobacteriales bacterium UPWRP_1]|nr:hypothetical protein C7N43_10245 [Sphingobacteriales bacterium UPWRP_1]
MRRIDMSKFSSIVVMRYAAAFLPVVAGFYLLAVSCGQVSTKPVEAEDAGFRKILDMCHAFDRLNKDLPKGHILPEEAEITLDSIIAPLREYYLRYSAAYCADTSWYFPIQGYSIRNVGGTARDKYGFVDNGCTFFERGINPGHPAYDIFIRDLNNDGIDDRTNRKANVLAVTGGIVVATEANWYLGSTQRGGKYIWLYNAIENSFFYYAHNEDVFVKPGDIVKPGQVIATVGRTGANAHKERSQTHLHISYYRYEPDNRLCPVQFYNRLKTARTVPNPSVS